MSVRSCPCVRLHSAFSRYPKSRLVDSNDVESDYMRRAQSVNLKDVMVADEFHC